MKKMTLEELLEQMKGVKTIDQYELEQTAFLFDTLHAPTEDE